MATGQKTKPTSFASIIRRIFFENLGLKLFSLLIALLLWLFVLGAEDVTATVEVPLFFKMPPDKVLVTDVPNKANVSVSGPWAAIKSWNADNLEVEINLINADLGPSVVYLEEKRFQLPPSLKLTRVNPSEVAISLAKKASKQAPVVPVQTGTPALGYVVKSIKVMPDKVLIEGAESDIQIVDEVLTEEIDVAERKQSFTVMTKPVRLSKNISFPQKELLEVAVTIKKDLEERTFPNVPVRVRNSRYVARVEPAEIPLTIMGPREVVESLQTKDIKAFVDAEKEEGDHPSTATTREVEFDPLPETVKIQAGPYMVKLIISDDERSAPKSPSKP
ncbi:MAG: hypothetical protein C4523_13435 [Myxococcales bacterium]|nr:MAG: hypothetical protein C4523_13435 [Myxococcales bacterium]